MYSHLLLSLLANETVERFFLNCCSFIEYKSIAFEVENKVNSGLLAKMTSVSGFYTVLATLIVVSRHPLMVQSCYLNGYDSGVCEDPGEYSSDLWFCGETVTYRACMPREYGHLVPRWKEHTKRNKDKWVRDNFLAERELRRSIEKNETMRDSGIDEYGNEGEVEIRFWDEGTDEDEEEECAVHKSEQTCNLAREDVEGDKCKWDKDYEVCRPRYMNDCSQAYMNFFCFLNFPRCDEYENSLILCKSVCENYFISCGYSKDMWRCGPSEFLNGESAEVPSKDPKTGVYDVYTRSFFPGQPFRANEFAEDDDETPLAVCTPSLINSAPERGWGHVSAVAVATSIIATAVRMVPYV